MKNIILSASILVAGFAASAQSTLITHLPATTTITGATITALNDQTVLVRYTQNNISYKAFYNKDGSWLHTVASYGETSLPVEVRHLLEKDRRGWNILYVDEIQTPEMAPVYRVQVKRDSRLVILRVSGDEIAIERELIAL